MQNHNDIKRLCLSLRYANAEILLRSSCLALLRNAASIASAAFLFSAIIFVFNQKTNKILASVDFKSLSVAEAFATLITHRTKTVSRIQSIQLSIQPTKSN